MIHTLKLYKKYVLVILLAGIFIYIRSLSNGYNLDDELVTINHPLTSVDAGVQWQEIFNSPYSIEKFGYTYGYRPMVHLSFALEHAMFGESPAISHLLNLFIYLLTGIFLFYFLLSWLGRQHLFLAALTTLIFMVHPLHVEVVASIKNRDELLAFLAAFLAMHAYIRLIEKTNIKYLLGLVLFSLVSLLSKKTAIPILLLIPLLDVLYYQRWSLKSLLIYLPILAWCLWVGFDFEWHPFSLSMLVLVPSFVLLFLLFFNREKLLLWCKEQKLLGTILHGFLAVLIGLLAWRVESYSLLLLLFPLLWSIVNHRFVIASIYILTFIVSGFILKSPVVIQIGAMAAFFLIQIGEGWKLTRNSVTIILILSALALEFALSPTVLLGIRQLSIALILSLMLLTNVKWAGLISFMLLAISFLFFGSFPLFSFVIFVFVLLHILSDLEAKERVRISQRWMNGLKISLMSLFAVLSFVFKMPSPSFSKHSKLEKKQLISLSNQVMEKNGIKEGRQLEFVENPLVYPHFKQEEIATGMHVVGAYLQLEIVPYPLRYYYGYKTVDVHDFSEWTTYLWMLLLIGLVLTAWFAFRTERLLTLAIILLLVPLLLASNIFTLVAGVIAERHAFASTLGFSLLIALIFIKLNMNSWTAMKHRKGLTVVFMSFIVLMSLQSWKRVGAWASPIQLMEHDEKACQSSAHAHSLLATSYIKSATEDLSLSPEQKNERISQAISQMKKAISIFPYLFNYHFDLGRFYVLKGDFAQAYIAFEDAHKLVPKNPLALDELVKCSFDLNRTEETIEFGEKLVQEVGPQEKTIELMAFQALRTQRFAVAEKWAKIGRNTFPRNPNFPRLISDAQTQKMIPMN
jgi:cytochrome c-type biogenesis protein CcmH/NrfG